jgi:modification methylase
MPESLPLSVWPTAQQTSLTQRKGRYVKDAMAHPGKMLPAIARHAIETYTEPGDIVLDPMCGIGTTLIEAMHLGRLGIGVEYEQRWTDVAKQNIDLAKSQGAPGTAIVNCGDGRDVAQLAEGVGGKVALIVTSPPYGPSLHGQVRAGDGPVQRTGASYSKDKTNLGYASTDALLGAFGDILRGCAELLKPGGFVVVTTRPWRRDGELVDLPGAVVRLTKETGLVAYERNIALLAGIRDSQLIARASFFQLGHVRKARENGVPLSIIAHEDVIVLRKRS